MLNFRGVVCTSVDLIWTYGGLLCCFCCQFKGPSSAKLGGVVLCVSLAKNLQFNHSQATNLSTLAHHPLGWVSWSFRAQPIKDGQLSACAGPKIPSPRGTIRVRYNARKIFESFCDPEDRILMITHWKLTYPLKMDGWKMKFNFWMVPFQGTC